MISIRMSESVAYHHENVAIRGGGGGGGGGVGCRGKTPSPNVAPMMLRQDSCYELVAMYDSRHRDRTVRGHLMGPLSDENWKNLLDIGPRQFVSVPCVYEERARQAPFASSVRRRFALLDLSLIRLHHISLMNS